ncbi:lactonase family protein [Lentibacillus saliphilus]|uniref:lactonase family protein n=1 Tax=Lentibacillus saliphilus TaxID=2737028 RepID=UPI001C30A861|nr:lactonase family protein [Lentibacillus saliphilus]
MRKMLLLILMLLLFAACSTDDTSEKKDHTDGHASSDNGERQNYPDHLPESLFSYEYDSEDDYEFRSLYSSLDGSTILFTTEEEIKREREKTAYVKYGKNDVINLKELSNASEADLEDRNCTRLHLSPNGQYITFSCSLDERMFVVYDTEQEEIVHHEESLDDPALRMFGITDNMDVLLENIDRDTVAIYTPETAQLKEFNLPELSGVPDETFESVYAANNGQTIILNTFSRLYVLDTKSGDLEEIADVKPYEERFKGETEGIRLSDIKVSPNGKYLFYRLDDISSDIYQSYNFVNVEQGETESFTDFGYDFVETIDNNGNAVIKGLGNLFLYQIDSGQNRIIPNVESGVYTDEITLTSDGKTLFFADRQNVSDDTEAYHLYRLTLEEAKKYEKVDFQATKEDRDKLLSEVQSTSSNKEGFTFYPVEGDVSDMFNDVWERSKHVLYPSVFPEQISLVNHYLGLKRVTQEIKLDATELTQRRLINVYAASYPDKERKDFCIDNDLELVETKDGVDYFFYLFYNDEVELAFVKDDWCYSIEGKGFTKEEMFDIANSMGKRENKPADVPLDTVKLPTKLPFKDVIIKNPRVAHHGRTDKYVFSVEYEDHSIPLKITYVVGYQEPSFIDNDETMEVELTHSMKGFYNEKWLQLYITDGTNYYGIETDVEIKDIKELGGKETIKEALIEIANSVE